MTGVTVGGITRTYAYNGDGLLASRTESGSTNTFLWDVATAPAVLVQADSDQVVSAFGPLYRRSGIFDYWFARDGLGSVRLETTHDTPRMSFRYAAYGAVAQSSGGTPTLVGFAGELADPSGLIYLRARWYAIGFEWAGVELLGHSVTIFGVTSGTGVPISAGTALVGASFVVAGAVTEISAALWIYFACK